MSVLCLGEVWLELNAATAPELTETFPAAGVQASAASTPHWAGRRLCWPSWEPTSLAVSWRPGLPGMVWIAPCSASRMPSPRRWCSSEQTPLCPTVPTPPGWPLGRNGWRPPRSGAPLPSAFPPPGWCPLRLAHLKALAAARDAGALCCYLPRLAQAAPYWPQREALCQTALQFLDRADVLFLEESDLLLLFGSRELRTALFALFTGHVQLIFFYKKDRILAFTRSVMASAAKKDQSPALVLYRMEKMGIHVIDLPRLREHVLEQLLSNDANTTECQGLPY